MKPISDKQLNVRIPEELMTRIEHYQREQTELRVKRFQAGEISPSEIECTRSEAVRELLEFSLDKKKVPKARRTRRKKTD